MVVKCVIKGCGSRAGDRGIKLHKIPRDIIIKKKWIDDFIHSINKQFIENKNTVVCSHYFEPKEYYETYRQKQKLHTFNNQAILTVLPDPIPAAAPSTDGHHYHNEHSYARK